MRCLNKHLETKIVNKLQKLIKFIDILTITAHPLFAAAAAAAHPSTSQDQFSMTHMPSAFSMFGAHPAFSSHLMGAEFGGLGSLRATASSLGASTSGSFTLHHFIGRLVLLCINY